MIGRETKIIAAPNGGFLPGMAATIAGSALLQRALTAGGPIKGAIGGAAQRLHGSSGHGFGRADATVRVAAGFSPASCGALAPEEEYRLAA